LSRNILITIHRGSRQIGGSCVELSCDGTRLIIDAGLPLDAESVNTPGVRLAVPGLFIDVPDEKPVDALIISHAHQDHYGLLDLVRDDVPVYMSTGTAKLVEITRQIRNHPPLAHEVRTFRWSDIIEVGPFRISPHLVDHSAFDAYAFEIEAGGKRIFYSGDFRDHGPISKTMEIIKDQVKPGVDALLMEGTMLGRQEEQVLTESDLADEAVRLCADCKNAVLVYQSGQNVSRTVAFYKAARRLNREFVLDFYMAHVMTELAGLGLSNSLPYPGHPSLEGVYAWFPSYLTDSQIAKGNGTIPNHYRRWERGQDVLRQQLDRTMLFVRPGMEGDLKLMGDLSGSVLFYSLWEGYQEEKKTKRFLDGVQKLGVTIHYLHTSGHATLPALQRLVDMLQPKALVPIHTEHPDGFDRFGVPLERVEDGVAIEI
jgi:ribonuclease J